MPNSTDPYNLSRFVHAQEDDYEQALSELRSGRKRTHWIWYIFPQIDGLALSSTSKRYAIKSVEEARAYLDHPILGVRLLECAGALLRVEGKSATEILGSPDDMKLKSCATLFASVLPAGSVFDRLLGKFYRAERDGKTFPILSAPFFLVCGFLHRFSMPIAFVLAHLFSVILNLFRQYWICVSKVFKKNLGARYFPNRYNCLLHRTAKPFLPFLPIQKRLMDRLLN